MRYVQTPWEVILVNAVRVIVAMEKLARISTSVLTDLIHVTRFQYTYTDI